LLPPKPTILKGHNIFLQSKNINKLFSSQSFLHPTTSLTTITIAISKDGEAIYQKHLIEVASELGMFYHY
jgi:hypothetical protein